jgi:hypothetical protein
VLYSTVLYLGVRGATELTRRCFLNTLGEDGALEDVGVKGSMKYAEKEVL